MRSITVIWPWDSVAWSSVRGNLVLEPARLGGTVPGEVPTTRIVPAGDLTVFSWGCYRWRRKDFATCIGHFAETGAIYEQIRVFLLKYATLRQHCQPKWLLNVIFIFTIGKQNTAYLQSLLCWHIVAYRVTQCELSSSPDGYPSFTDIPLLTLSLQLTGLFWP